jgi:uncharacterized membrane protein YdjX (TVP38/TMEM64 family)
MIYENKPNKTQISADNIELTIWDHIKAPENRSAIIKTALAFLFIAGILLYTGIEVRESRVISPQSIAVVFNQYKSIAAILYVLLLIAAVMSPLPDAPVIIAGGFFFGPVTGSLLTILGQAVGSYIDFLLARKLGKQFVQRKFPKAGGLINRYSHKLGWQTVFLMRLFPTLSFDTLSYIAGISDLSFRAYALATLAGLIPLAIITTMIGNSVNLRSWHGAILTLVIGGGIILVISAIFHLSQRYYKGKRKPQ